MAKCCDRCKKPIDRNDTMKIKFVWNFKEFVKSIDVAIMRKRQGIANPSFYLKTAKGKWDLCEKCTKELADFLTKND